MDEISIVPFKFKHLDALIGMHADNKYPHTQLITYKSLPKIGYIAYFNGRVPIAAGFLRRVEGGFGQIDTLVSNPYLGSIVRHNGIRRIVDALIEDAKRLKLQGIISFTADSGVLSRAKDLGFVEINQAVIVLELP